jgi:hypothetical protein
MPKRAAADARPGPEKASRGASGQTREKPPEDEMGEFEDAWEDEIEGDDDDAAQSDGVCVCDLFAPGCITHAQAVFARARVYPDS